MNVQTIFADKNASVSDYRHLANDQLMVNSIFPTLQGEGPYAGWPATFVRLSGCNLGGKGVNGPGCAWCDTDFRLANAKTLDFADILIEVMKAKDSVTQHNLTGVGIHEHKRHLVVITGGEPLLQPNTPAFITYLLNHGFKVQIESNGMFARPIDKEATLIISPKVPNNRSSYLKLPDANFQRADCLKMVVSADPLNAHHYLPDWVFDFAERKPVYISPIACYVDSPKKFSVDKSQFADLIADAWDDDTYDRMLTRANYMYAAQLAIKHSFRLSIQMHLFAVIP